MEGLNGRRRASVFPRAIFFGFVTAASFAAALPVFAASPVTVGGPFSLVAPDGNTVTDSDFRGKWMLVFFGYTYCPDICPTTLSEMAIALDRLGEEGKAVQPIFITVDPKRDTPDVIGQYTRAIDPRIMGLSGSPQQLTAAAREYGAYSERHGSGHHGDHLIDHSTYIYVMDPQGKFVRGLEGGASGDEIADTLRRLIAQTK
ncbi:SCO family protein [Sinorhizobium alkalisoli]|uniref:SCO family protein n=1 Tax=Sinorhizobium alkalisoli TaxID=1752398 RepID=UPI00124EEB68|nr:SCO family protein [Sinorhizobium alkalisoli]QFI68577.1 Cytochrome oxidase biogenesis protein Sco1/SenC/PrrC copper metallochaperone [Sinorhizobium alkalisoli]